jgi:hypothetical protein
VNERERIAEYERLTGKKPPRLPMTDPLGWQYDYTGQSEEDKRRLAEALDLDDRDLDVQIVSREQGKSL